MALQMTSCLRIVCIAFFSTFLFILPPAILLAAGGPSSEVTYFELYTKIIHAVDAGTLDRSIGKKAHSLNSELQKEIIATDVRLETLKSDSLKVEGSRRDELLDELVAAGAEKERMYLDYRQRLAQLADFDKQDTAAVTASPAGQATGNESAKAVNADGELPESKVRSVIFTSTPEDVTSGDFD